MPSTPFQLKRSQPALSFCSFALALSIALTLPASAGETTAAMNKVLRGNGLTPAEAATLRESIAQGVAQERMPKTHHEHFAEQLKRYGLNDEARQFLASQEASASTSDGRRVSAAPDNPAEAARAQVASGQRERTSAAVGNAANISGSRGSAVAGTGQSRPLGGGAVDNAAAEQVAEVDDQPVPQLGPRLPPDDRSLALVVNRIMRGDALSSEQQELLHRGLADDTLNRLIPVDRHDDFLNQLERYGLQEEAVMFRAGLSSQGDLLASLAGTPRPIYRQDFIEEYIEGVQYFTNQLGNNIERRKGSQLIVVDYDNRIMRIEDPLAGQTLERVGSSCLLNSGGLSGKASPPQTYGTDMIVFDQPVNGRIRYRERSDGGYITYYHDYSVQRYALSWSEQSGASLPAYFFGARVVPVRDDEGRRTGTRTQAPEWHRFTCSVRSINF